jgi:biopolymer transport protein ExbD
MKFRRKDRLKIRANADITPLIDVIFQLLIFFMLSATFVVQTSINIQSPEAQGATNLEQKDITITIAVDDDDPDGPGAIFVDDVQLSMGELRDYIYGLRAQRDPEQPPFVLIRPDARIRTGQLVEVFGILNSLDITNYGVAARPPEEEP